MPAESVFLVVSVASVKVAPSKSLLTSVFFAESLAFTPSFQSTVSFTHFFKTTGSRPPSSVTCSALVFTFGTVNVPLLDSPGACLASWKPSSLTFALTSVSPFTLSTGRVMTPLLSTDPSPSVIFHVPFSFFATVFLSPPSAPV